MVSGIKVLIAGIEILSVCQDKYLIKCDVCRFFCQHCALMFRECFIDVEMTQGIGDQVNLHGINVFGHLRHGKPQSVRKFQ